jgi:hypothetical protein
MEREMVFCIQVDQEHVGMYDCKTKVLIHKGREVRAPIPSLLEVFDIFQHFYGYEDETEREFAKRIHFIPSFGENVDDIPF